MGYPGMTRNFVAESSASGVMVFRVNEVGFFEDAGRDNIYAGDVSDWNFNVNVGGAATVVIQGNLNDPSVEEQWFDISSVTSSSVVQRGDYGVKFLRANVGPYTSGSVTVEFFGGQ